QTTSSEPRGSGGEGGENNGNRSSSSLDPSAQQLLNEFVANSGPMVNDQPTDINRTSSPTPALNDEEPVLPGSFINDDLDNRPQIYDENAATDAEAGTLGSPLLPPPEIPRENQHDRSNIDQSNIVHGKRQRKRNSERRAIYLA